MKGQVITINGKEYKSKLSYYKTLSERKPNETLNSYYSRLYTTYDEVAKTRNLERQREIMKERYKNDENFRQDKINKAKERYHSKK